MNKLVYQENLVQLSSWYILKRQILCWCNLLLVNLRFKATKKGRPITCTASRYIYMYISIYLYIHIYINYYTLSSDQKIKKFLKN